MKRPRQLEVEEQHNAEVGKSSSRFKATCKPSSFRGHLKIVATPSSNLEGSGTHKEAESSRERALGGMLWRTVCRIL